MSLTFFVKHIVCFFVASRFFAHKGLSRLPAFCTTPDCVIGVRACPVLWLWG